MLLGIIITILVSLLTTVVFILAENKEEIWNNIEFKDGDNNE